jgi:uncharacterized protein YqhQ
MEDKLITYGGQAVIEGVMMRGRKVYALAVRAPDGQIVTRVAPLSGIYRSRLTRIPLLRGLVLLWDALGLGLGALRDAANLQMPAGEKLEGAALYVTFGLALTIAVLIFVLLPAGGGWLTERYLSWNAWWSNLIEGVLRLLLLIGYLWVVGFWPDVRRVLAYHGAEHKTINAWEDGAEMRPAVVARYSCQHPRCGTAFLLSVAVIAFLVFALLGPLPVIWRMLTRLLLIPLVAGLAYEYIRWTAAHLYSPLVRLLAAPNLALQSLTTREPDESMLEVAIAAFQAMRAGEEQ